METRSHLGAVLNLAQRIVAGKDRLTDVTDLKFGFGANLL